MTKAELLIRVNQITGRAETSIDTELLEVVEEIARRTCSITAESTGNATENVAYITKPADSVMIDYVVVDGEKLDKITFSEYLQDRLNGFVERGTKIYIRPTPVSALSYTIYYRQEHPATVETISLDDKYKPAVIAFTASKIYDKYEIYDKRDAQEQLYERLLEKVSEPETFICEGRPK
jgi:hypothetical protein